MSNGMTKKSLNDLVGWGLIWALAKYAGDKEIIRVGSVYFGYLTGELVTIKSEDDGRDRRVSGVHIYTPDDHKKLLSTFDLNPVETDDGNYRYSIDGVGDVYGFDRGEVKARAVIAEKLKCLEVDFPS